MRKHVRPGTLTIPGPVMYASRTAWPVLALRSVPYVRLAIRAPFARTALTATTRSQMEPTNAWLASPTARHVRMRLIARPARVDILEVPARFVSMDTYKWGLPATPAIASWPIAVCV